MIYTTTVPFTGRNFNITTYLMAITVIANNAGCGACADLYANPVSCSSCEIFVLNVSYTTTARRLLASNVNINTKITTSSQQTAVNLQRSINSTASQQTISQYLGQTIIITEPPEIVTEVVYVTVEETPQPTSSSDTGVIVGVTVSVVVVVAIVIVVIVLLWPKQITVKHEVGLKSVGARLIGQRCVGEKRTKDGKPKVSHDPANSARQAQLIFKLDNKRFR